MDNKSNTTKKPFYKRKGFLWPVGIVLTFLIVIAITFRVSPWPGALVIRTVFNDNGEKTTQALEAHKPSTPIKVIKNVPYGDENNDDTLLDVYIPESAINERKTLPVVIWTHGGAWLSGSKDDYATYYELIAAEGFVVIAPNYSLAPEKTYPTPVFQLNDVHNYVLKNSKDLHVDTRSVVLAGDSAGAQLSAQMAALVTNANYARELNIEPALTKDQLKGVVLNCGIYKMEELAHPNPSVSKLVGWGTDITVWAYSDTHNYNDPIIRQMSPYYYVTNDFPPTYISGGNDDSLTNVQSKPLAAELRQKGVSVDELFYDENHQPKLPHEYQFNLDTDDGKKALDRTLEFLKRRTQN